jgi:hypothetical protein
MRVGSQRSWCVVVVGGAGVVAVDGIVENYPPIHTSHDEVIDSAWGPGKLSNGSQNQQTVWLLGPIIETKQRQSREQVTQADAAPNQKANFRRRNGNNSTRTGRTTIKLKEEEEEILTVVVIFTAAAAAHPLQ